MKTLYFLLLFLTISISNQVFSQESSARTTLVGTWLFNYEKSVEEMDISSRLNLDTIPTFHREIVEKNYKGRLVTYKENGDYEQEKVGKSKVYGKWVLSEDEKNVTITNSLGIEYNYKINILTTNQMVLEPILGEGNKMLIPVWFMSKVNN